MATYKPPPREVDHPTEVGDVGEGAEQSLDGAEDAFIRDIGRERLLGVDDTRNCLHSVGGATGLGPKELIEIYVRSLSECK